MFLLLFFFLLELAKGGKKRVKKQEDNQIANFGTTQSEIDHADLQR